MFESQSQQKKDDFFKESFDKCADIIPTCKDALKKGDLLQLFIILDNFSKKNKSSYAIIGGQKKEGFPQSDGPHTFKPTAIERKNACEEIAKNAAEKKWKYNPNSNIIFKNQLDELAFFNQSSRLTLFFKFKSNTVVTEINELRDKYISRSPLILAIGIILILTLYYFISQKYDRALNIITSEKELDPFAGQSLKFNSILFRSKDYKKVKLNLSDEELKIMKLIKKKGIQVSEILEKSKFDELDTFEILTKLGKKQAINIKEDEE
jgi:hypothetical protein